jgi:hypothetical protein
MYQISCSCGKYYIGQIGRSFKDRLKDLDTTHNRISKLVIVEHFFKFKHLIFFDQTKIIASIAYYASCPIREALEIEKHPNNFNSEDGYKLSQSWNPTIHHLH